MASNKMQIEGSLQYCILRHRLTFETSRGVLQSLDFRGYHLGSETDIRQDDPIPCIPIPPFLKSFLVLIPDSPLARIKVLVPDGRIHWDSRAQCITITPQDHNADATLSHHVYTVHPHIFHLCAPTKEARLFLAALYATGDCNAAIPGLGKTGGQAALELVRQCAGCTPLTPAEEQNLAAVSAHAAHTPALQLICAHVYASSRDLDFLWGTAAAPQNAVLWRAGEESVYMAHRNSATRGRLLHFPIGNMREALTPFERRLVLGQPHEYQRACDVVIVRDQILPNTFDRSVAAASAVLQKCREVMAGLAESLSAGPEMEVSVRSEVPFETGPLQRTSMGRELVEDLEASLKEHRRVARSALVAVNSSEALPRVEEALSELLQRVRAAKNMLEAVIISGIETSLPCSERGATVQALKAAGLVASVAVIDILTLPLNIGAVLERLCRIYLHASHALIFNP